MIDFEKALDEELVQLRQMLLEKNRAYGNSALDPVRIFSQADPVEQLRVRIDDKLSRLKRGQAAGEDVRLDLVGYLVLLGIAERGARSLRGETMEELRERFGIDAKFFSDRPLRSA